MVLLCFFIIFFSTDQAGKESIIHKIFLNEKGEGNGAGQSAAKDRQAASVATFPQQKLESILNEFSLSKSEKTDGILVQFKDDLYEKGSYRLGSAQKNALLIFLKKIQPYQNQISMTFIGHADGDQVNGGSRKIYQDNFELSSIRATRALQFAVQFGFPEDQVSAKGNSKNSRVTRSISVLIKPKGDLL